MAVIKDGLGGTGTLAIDTNTDAARVQDRPLDVGTLGAYQLSATSGTMAAGLSASSPIFSMRWGDSTRAIIVRRVGILATHVATAFAAGAFTFDMVAARAFTASDTGQTALTPSGNLYKKRTSFGTSLITDMRISTTASLGSGTRTLDANAMATIRGWIPATATGFNFVGSQVGGQPMTAAAAAATGIHCSRVLDLWFPEIGNSWPLVFVQNEGFIIRATVPGTGTWSFTVEMEWAEIATTAGYN
jgi:hypothetical protein